jgi:hypothetical protein
MHLKMTLLNWKTILFLFIVHGSSSEVAAQSTKVVKETLVEPSVK